jgi:succinate dehydrogenase/fumarate reductase-like Fe-S protein
MKDKQRDEQILNDRFSTGQKRKYENSSEISCGLCYVDCKQPKLQTLIGFPKIPMQIMKFHFLVMDVIVLCALMCAKS